VTSQIERFANEARSGRCHAWRRAIAAIVGAGAAILSAAAFAKPSCSFNSSAPVSFGVYDVLSAMPNVNGVGSITIKCQGDGPQTFVVGLSRGQSNSYALRMMKSGGNALNYNLYTSTQRTRVWGDGTGGSTTMTVERNSKTTLSIFGEIPAGQDAATGIYLDNIAATVDF
jgi:spore coat protein U-like protein